MTPVSPALSRFPDEASPRYAGWRVVAACFIGAVFCWGFGLYGHGVYLAELHRLHGWSTSLISAGASLYYVVSATLVIFINDAMTRYGPRRVMLSGTCCLAGAVALLGCITTPWQLFAVYTLLAAGAAAMHTGAISNVLGLWFDRQRGLAISLALTGASCGGIFITPLLVIAIERFGFRDTMLASAAIIMLAVIPFMAAWIDRPARAASSRATPDAPAGWTRPRAMRRWAFWSVAGPLALGLMAQIGFFVHQIAFLEPAIGRTQAGLSVMVMAVAGIIGRLVLGFFNQRLDMRLFTALSVLSQAAALAVMMLTTNVVVLFAAVAVFGLSIGNMITLPALIIQREFDQASFGLLVGLSTAIGQFTCVVGPALLGLARDLTGGYAASLSICIALEIIAAVLVLMRPQRAARA